MIHRMSPPGYFRILTILVILSQENGIAFVYFVYFAVQLCASASLRWKNIEHPMSLPAGCRRSQWGVHPPFQLFAPVRAV